MTDRWTVRAVVCLLGTFAIIGLSGTIWLASHDADPANLTAVVGLTATALGALGAVLVSTRSNSPDEPPPAPVPVNIQQAPGDPVPVSEVHPGG